MKIELFPSSSDIFNKFNPSLTASKVINVAKAGALSDDLQRQVSLKLKKNLSISGCSVRERVEKLKGD